MNRKPSIRKPDPPLPLGGRTRVLHAPSAVPKAPGVISIAGAGGGLGKTYATAALGTSLARAGRKVLLLDADPGPADLATLAGVCPRHSTKAFFSGAKALTELVVKGPEGIHLLPLRVDIKSRDVLQWKLRLREGIETLRDRFDLVLIDAGADSSENALFLHVAAQEILLIATPERKVIEATSAMLHTLQARTRRRSFHLLVNRAKTEAAALEVYRRLTLSAALDMDIALDYLGFFCQARRFAPFPEVGRERGGLPRRMTDAAERLLEILENPHPGGTFQFFWEQHLLAGCRCETTSSL